MKEKLLSETSKSLYRQNTLKYIEFEHSCKSKKWLEREIDDRVVEYWQISEYNFMVKLKADEGIDGGVFYALFIAPKMNFYLNNIEYGIIEGKRTFTGFGCFFCVL